MRRPLLRSALRARLGAGSVAALIVLASGTAQPAPPDAVRANGRYQVEWRDIQVPTSWATGEVRDVALAIVNHSGETWPDLLHADRATGRGAVRITYCWRDAPSTDCNRERTELPAPLPPGASADVLVRVRAPLSPGRYVLELDLVEELVTLFRDRGAPTWKADVLVLAKDAPSATADHLLHVSLLVLVSIAVLFWCGFGVTNLLPGGGTSAAGPLLIPFVGLGALSLVGHAVATLPPGTDGTFVGILIGFGGLNVAAWMDGARPRFRRRHLGAWAAALLAVALGVQPLLRVGYLTALGGEIDSTVYVSRASWMQEHGLLVPPERATTDYVKVSAHDNLVAGLRQGDQYALAFVSSLTGHRPHQLFSIFMAVFYGLMPLGAYVFARFACRLRSSTATLAALLVAVQPILHYATMNSFFSQAAALGFFPVTVYALTRAFRARGLRAVPLAAVLLAALSTLYSVYAVLALPLAGIGIGLRLLGARGRRGRALVAVAGRAALVAAATLAVCPVGWWQTARGMKVVTQVSTSPETSFQGNHAVFPPPGEIVGLVSHPVLVHSFPVASPARAFTWPATAVAGLLVAAGLLSAPRPGRTIGAAVLALLALAAFHQRFVVNGGLGFPYGYFKISALSAPFVLVFFAQGAAWAVERGRRSAGAARFLLPGLGGLAACVVGATALHNVQVAVPFVAEWKVDWDALQLERVRHLVPRDEPLLVEDQTWPGRSWNLYLLRHGRQYDRGPVGFQPAPPEWESPRLIRHALLVASHVEMTPRAGEPWFDRRQSDLLWSRGRYRLLRRRDGALADVRVAAPLGTDPIRIDPGAGALSVSVRAGGIAPTQVLHACPGELELWFDAAAPAAVAVTQAGSTRTEALAPGAHGLRLPVLPTEVRLQSGSAVTLERVKALGTPAHRP